MEKVWTSQIRVLWKTLFFCSDSSHLPGSPISTILLFGQVSLKVLAKLDSLPPRFSSKNMSPINKMSKLSAKNFDTLRKIHKVKLHTLCCICLCMCYFLAGHHGNYKNWVLFMLPKNLWLIFIGLEQFECLKVNFFKNNTCLKVS